MEKLYILWTNADELVSEQMVLAPSHLLWVL